MRHALSLLVVPFVALAALAGCSSDDDADDAQASQLSAAQRAELDAQIAELKEKVRQLELRIAADEGFKQALERELDKAKAALKAAEDKLAAEDYAGAVAELAAATKALADLQAAWDALPGSVTLEAKFAFGAADLQLDTPYELSTGKTFTFSEVRYWLSNVKLTVAGGATFTVPNAYYLVEVMQQQNLSNGATGTHTLPANRRESVVIGGVPSGSYTGVEFAVGVDPVRNDNLALGGGELHVLKNMTSDNGWMWFTSYIFSKVRGSYAQGDDEPIAVAWETGANENYRVISKTFSAPVKVGAGVDTKVSLRADVKKLFTDLDAEATPTIKAAQAAERTTLANNWANAFELVGATGQ
ncbi:MAG: hypothetical protein KIS78_21730 [Labilithrix sp.]|nr:hypothetical protein [Labilithrix sp.]MCW5835036.1 hypothetical protein [Labilithrix sp.]